MTCRLQSLSQYKMRQTTNMITLTENADFKSDICTFLIAIPWLCGHLKKATEKSRKERVSEILACNANPVIKIVILSIDCHTEINSICEFGGKHYFFVVSRSMIFSRSLAFLVMADI